MIEQADLRQLLRRVLPPRVVAWIRARRATRGPRRMTSGIGRGLMFDPGPSNPAYGRGDNELAVQRALAARLRPGQVLYDVGANVGFFTVIGARLVGPSGHVYAFEPSPESARFARENCQRNEFTNVTVIEKAVSDRAGAGELVLARFSGGAALSITTPPPDATSTLAVDVTTIDDEVSKQRVRPPAVVKIDVEGVEAEVIGGMVATIRTHRPTIICEIDDATQEGFERKYSACVSLVQSLGYDVDRLEDSYPEAGWVVGHFVADPTPTAKGP